MNITKLLAGSCVVLVFWLWWVIDDYGTLKANHKLLTSSFNEQVNINQDYQARIKSLHDLDVKHTQELNNAKTEISRLRDLSERHPERVYIKANCSKSEGVTTSGVDDATTARPTDSAIRNYWLLRERIAESEQMIKGLQDYINNHCS
ncbi:TPA: lysis protein [Proteus mirabilis]|uniref:lysis protein n=1 Tax=Proteus mirabilis TaxID=584 RepID=UPI000537760B|nr:lysis protein [Proteus mirabilis]DAL41490.1 MAG TPA_asm: Rz lysis protein [Caudoviricetes sp.]AUT92103.1 lysis protein [Proteus mirabilis]EKW0544696.1 lysis protein [Proteus mirabilis]EKW4849851.1 lysis protein [Proteus mirabilis]EKY0560086.1 lysis protein [Proteus mirabilis]